MTAVHPDGYRPAKGTSFAVIGQHSVLFHEARQLLFELNEVAAFAWCRLSDGATVDTVVANSIDRGLAPGLARERVEEAVAGWIRLGLIEATRVIRRRQRVLAGDLCVELCYGTESLADAAMPEFRPLESADRPLARRIEVVESAGRILLHRDGEEPVACSRDELIPALRAALAAEALAFACYEVALHAACMISGENALLITGNPGEGKSTLAVALSAAGLSYDGDDVALLHADGRVTGMAFAPALKQGSWPLLEGRRPDIADLPIHIRPDRQRVRYLRTAPYAAPMPRPVRWIVTLHRDATATTTLERSDPVDALRDLIGGASARGSRLTADGFRAVHAALATAECYRLTVADLDHAVDLLAGICR